MRLDLRPRTPLTPFGTEPAEESKPLATLADGCTCLLSRGRRGVELCRLAWSEGSGDHLAPLVISPAQFAA